MLTTLYSYFPAIDDGAASQGSPNSSNTSEPRWRISSRGRRKGARATGHRTITDPLQLTTREGGGGPGKEGLRLSGLASVSAVQERQFRNPLPAKDLQVERGYAVGQDLMPPPLRPTNPKRQDVRPQHSVNGHQPITSPHNRRKSKSTPNLRQLVVRQSEPRLPQEVLEKLARDERLANGRSQASYTARSSASSRDPITGSTTKSTPPIAAKSRSDLTGLTKRLLGEDDVQDSRSVAVESTSDSSSLDRELGISPATPSQLSVQDSTQAPVWKRSPDTSWLDYEEDT